VVDLKRFRFLALALIVSAGFFAGLTLFNEASWFAACAGFAFTAVLVFHAAFSPGTETIPGAALPEKTAHDESAIEIFIEALPDPCLLLNSRGAVIAFNANAASLMPGLGKNQPLSFYLRSPALNDAVAQAFNGKASRIDIEEKIPVERWSSFFLSPLSLARSGKVDHACITIHDRTEQKRSERMRVDFVANASHELRTPLASLLGFVETLRGPARNDEISREHFLQIMQLQAKRMSRLIDDLLSLSRIEMHLHVQPETPLEIAPLLQSTLDGLKPLAAERGVELVLRKPDERLMVQGDRDELFRAFENLIENAIKYGESGKKVEVEVRAPLKNAPEKMIRVSVRDFGPGIAAAHLPRLTERFYRVDEASSREKGGTGLGLAIVKHILNRHRGSLEIESRPGQGSVFTALLPTTA
jgi:two-component system phosphate regulon sensor histidine kinase PhoR